MKTLVPSVLLVALFASSATASLAGGDLAVTFELNDALIKDKPLPGVHLRLSAPAGPDAGSGAPVFEGTTDSSGRLAANLTAGEYLATYRKAGYVPIADTTVSVHTAGQVITTSLTPMLESGATRVRRIRVVLNWGSDRSQVKDADAHMAPAAGSADQEVYYMEKRFDGPGAYSIALDVDDVDWGGPETITLTEPPPGDYLYWVHNYSGDSSLGQSDVIVRVFIDHRLAGEFKAPASADQRYFRPFKAIRVGPALAATVVEFQPQEVVASAHLEKPPGPWTDPDGFSCEGCEGVGLVIFIVIGLLIATAFLNRRR